MGEMRDLILLGELKLTNAKGMACINPARSSVQLPCVQWQQWQQGVIGVE